MQFVILLTYLTIHYLKIHWHYINYLFPDSKLFVIKKYNKKKVNLTSNFKFQNIVYKIVLFPNYDLKLESAPKGAQCDTVASVSPTEVFSYKTESPVATKLPSVEPARSTFCYDILNTKNTFFLSVVPVRQKVLQFNRYCASVVFYF